MSQPDSQAEAIVDALLGMPREERAAYLAQACGADAQKRLLVEGMLKAHEQAEALIQMRGSQARKTIAVSPLPISKDTPSTALTIPSWVLNCVRKSRTDSSVSTGARC